MRPISTRIANMRLGEPMVLPSDVRLRKIPEGFRQRIEAWWNMCGLKRLTVDGADKFMPLSAVEMAGQRRFGQATKKGTYSRRRDAATLTHEKTHRATEGVIHKGTKQGDALDEAVSFATEVALFGNSPHVDRILTSGSYNPDVEHLTRLLLRVFYIYGQGDFVEVAQMLVNTPDQENHPVDLLLGYPDQLIPWAIQDLWSKIGILEHDAEKIVAAVQPDQVQYRFPPTYTAQDIVIDVYFAHCFGLPAEAIAHLRQKQGYKTVEEAMADESPIKKNVINAYRRLTSTMLILTEKEVGAVRSQVGGILGRDMADYAIAAWEDMEATVASIGELYGDTVVAALMEVAAESTLVAKQISESLPLLAEIVGHDRKLAVAFIERFSWDEEFRNFCITAGFTDIKKVLYMDYEWTNITAPKAELSFFQRHHMAAFLSFPMNAAFRRGRQQGPSGSYLGCISKASRTVTQRVPIEYQDRTLALIPRINNVLWFIREGGEVFMNSDLPLKTFLEKMNSAAPKCKYPNSGISFSKWNTVEIHTNTDLVLINLFDRSQAISAEYTGTEEERNALFFHTLETLVTEMENIVKAALSQPEPAVTEERK